jgi:CO dehydrogenase/acetyl-CoA synthase gamma subunit (corrinoid Fe-S protein)
VKDFLPAPASPVPQVSSQMSHEDRRGTLFARLGVGRDNYCIAPGLYDIGAPDVQSPLMVTANYKLSFNVLRSHLAGISAWILVVNTRGINVWCAAGKGTFSTQEVAYRVKADRLADIVTHRRLILPQLSATGVSAHQVKPLCGFEIVWGPVHA